MKRLAGIFLVGGVLFVGAILTLRADSASAYIPPKRIKGPKSRVLRKAEILALQKASSKQPVNSSSTSTTTTKAK